MIRYQTGMILRDTYELVSPLGQGGMGEVWIARHLRLPEKPLAVKMIYQDNPQLLERLRREARVMAGLNHPNIVTVIDLNTLPSGHPFMVMELLKGAPLSDVIRRQDYTYDEVDNWLYQMGDALHTAHNSGVIHRDLKPDNLFLCEDGKVKVLDFGISKISFMDQLSISGALLGTPYYMSPEQVEGDEVDERSDLFALGLITIELITKARPVNGDSLPQVFKAIREFKKPPCPEGFNQERWNLIDLAIASRLEDRSATIADWLGLFLGKELPQRKTHLSDSLDLDQTLDHGQPVTIQTDEQQVHPQLQTETLASRDKLDVTATQGMAQAQHSTAETPEALSRSKGVKSSVEEIESDFRSRGHDTSPNFMKPILLLSMLTIVICLLLYMFRGESGFREKLELKPVEKRSINSDHLKSDPLQDITASQTKPLPVQIVSENYRAAMIKSLELPSQVKGWAPLVLLRERLDRSPNQIESSIIAEIFQVIEKDEPYDLERLLSELIKLSDQIGDDDIKRWATATLTAQICTRDAFKALQLYRGLEWAERELIKGALVPCKQILFINESSP